MEGIILVIGVTTLAMIISIPCGYARQNFPKFSVMWWILIHLPIPIIVFLRIKAGLNWHFIPLTLGSSVAGQMLGATISRRRKKNAEAP